MRLSVDDGCAADVRVAELARKYNIECVFYWPIEWEKLALSKGYMGLSLEEAQAIAAEFEIGAHTITHPLLTKIDFESAMYEATACKGMLEKMFDIKVTKFAPPRGYLNPELTTELAIIYDEIRLTRQPGLCHVHPNSGANDNRPWREVLKTSDINELWCHSWELDKYNLWDELEEALK